MTFEAGSSSAPTACFSTPKHGNNDEYQNAAGNCSPKKPRHIQRTYSRNHQSGVARDHIRGVVREAPSPSAPSTSDAQSLDDTNKRMKPAEISQSNPLKRTKRSSEYFEGRVSPIALASASRHSSTNENEDTQRWMTRGQKRRGRKTRGTCVSFFHHSGC